MLSLKPGIRGACLCLSVLFLLTACSGVHTYVNTFRVEGDQFALSANSVKGSIRVTPYNEAQAQSLESGYYRSKLQKKLQQLGFSAPKSGEESEFVAHLNYQIVEREVDAPFEYHTHFSTAFDRYAGNHVVVLDKNTQIEYVRTIGIIIKRSKTDQPIYEVTGVSRGGCGVMSVVFDEMLEGMFKHFPAENGSLQKVRVDGSTRC